MRLEREDGTTWDDPSAETIAEVLGSLGRPGTRFVILERGPDFYIQAGADEDGACGLEFREGSDASHMRCTDDPLRVREVVRAFQDYAAPNDDWRDRFTWKPLNPPRRPKTPEPQNAAPELPGMKRSGCLSVVAAVIALGAVAALGAWVALVP
jgi:hypothetical protein